MLKEFRFEQHVVGSERLQLVFPGFDASISRVLQHDEYTELFFSVQLVFSLPFLSGICFRFSLLSCG